MNFQIALGPSRYYYRKIEERFQLEPSAADFFYIKNKNLIVVPYFMFNKVAAYTLN